MASLRIHMRQMGFWLSLSVALPLSAQQTTWSVGTSLGYALPHRNEMLALVTGHSREMTCRIGNWNTTGWRQNWQQHGPVWQGVQVGWLNGGSEELGDMASAMWLVELPVRRRWHIELGSGVGWSTSPYDPIERPLSIAIGSRLNAAIHLGTTVQVVQREQSWVAVGAGFTHFSNGALALPNLGINNVHLRVRAGWKTPHRFPERTPAAWMDTTEGWHWACAGRIGARDINLPGGVLHPTVSVGAYAATQSNGDPLVGASRRPRPQPKPAAIQRNAAVHAAKAPTFKPRWRQPPFWACAVDAAPRVGMDPTGRSPRPRAFPSHFGLCCSPFLGHRNGIAFLSHSGRLPVHRHTIQPSCIPLIRGKWCRMHPETSGDRLYSPDRPG